MLDRLPVELIDLVLLAIPLPPRRLQEDNPAPHLTRALAPCTLVCRVIRRRARHIIWRDLHVFRKADYPAVGGGAEAKDVWRHVRKFQADSVDGEQLEGYLKPLGRHGLLRHLCLGDIDISVELSGLSQTFPKLRTLALRSLELHSSFPSPQPFQHLISLSLHFLDPVEPATWSSLLLPSNFPSLRALAVTQSPLATHLYRYHPDPTEETLRSIDENTSKDALAGPDEADLLPLLSQLDFLQSDTFHPHGIAPSLWNADPSTPVVWTVEPCYQGNPSRRGQVGDNLNGFRNSISDPFPPPLPIRHIRLLPLFERLLPPDEPDVAAVDPRITNEEKRRIRAESLWRTARREYWMWEEHMEKTLGALLAFVRRGEKLQSLHLPEYLKPELPGGADPNLRVVASLHDPHEELMSALLEACARRRVEVRWHGDSAAEHGKVSESFWRYAKELKRRIGERA